MKTEITHKLIGITALILSAGLLSTTAQAYSTTTIYPFTFAYEEDQAVVIDCDNSYAGSNRNHHP